MGMGVWAKLQMWSCFERLSQRLRTVLRHLALDILVLFFLFLVSLLFLVSAFCFVSVLVLVLFGLL